MIKCAESKNESIIKCETRGLYQPIKERSRLICKLIHDFFPYIYIDKSFFISSHVKTVLCVFIHMMVDYGVDFLFLIEYLIANYTFLRCHW